MTGPNEEWRHSGCRIVEPCGCNAIQSEDPLLCLCHWATARISAVVDVLAPLVAERYQMDLADVELVLYEGVDLGLLVAMRHPEIVPVMVNHAHVHEVGYYEANVRLEREAGLDLGGIDGPIDEPLHAIETVWP